MAAVTICSDFGAPKNKVWQSRSNSDGFLPKHYCLWYSVKVKEESEKIGLKLNIQKTKIMASGPITSWEIDGETVETVSDFTFLGSKITAALKLKDAYSLEEKLWPT